MRRVIALVLLLIGGLAGCSDPGAGESQRTVSQSQVQSAVVEEMHTPAMQRTIRDLVLSSEARAILTSAAGQKELKDSLLSALASAPVQRQLQDQVQSILTSPQGQKSLDALIRAALIKLASGGGGGGQERGTGG
jgi:hypothetical protein